MIEDIDGIGETIASRIKQQTEASSLEELDDPLVLGELPTIEGIGSKKQEAIVSALDQIGEEYRSKSWLEDERNWTEAGIRDFLGEPDKRQKNPNYTSAPKMKLYRMSRVRSTEMEPDFQEWLLKSLKRQKSAEEAAQKAVETKRRKTLRKVKRKTIGCRRTPPLPAVREEAIDWFNNRKLHRADTWNFSGRASWNSDQEFLDRISVNYVRHALIRVGKSWYEGAIERLEGEVGKGTAYRALKRRVLRTIAEEYPDLSHECQRQIEEIEKTG